VGALTGLGIAYAKSGDQTTARKIIQEMESLSKRSYVSPIYIGIVYGALGERNQEFDLYAKAYEDCSEYLLWLTLDPLFDQVRSDSRFAELAKESRSRPLRVRTGMKPIKEWPPTCANQLPNPRLLRFRNISKSFVSMRLANPDPIGAH
jgi:hypothetical protein